MEYIYSEAEHSEAVKNKLLVNTYAENQKVIRDYFISHCNREKNGYCDGCILIKTAFTEHDWHKCMAGLSMECSK